MNTSQRKSTRSQICQIEEDILTVLLKQELYGLQICQAFEEASDGRQRLSVGTLYPVLARLEARNLLNSRMEENPNRGARRKYFRITPGGITALNEARNLRERLCDWSPALA
jgi:PadR family transcriptional regulator, regulatory protein PadR